MSVNPNARETISWSAEGPNNKLIYIWDRQPESPDFNCVLLNEKDGAQNLEQQLPLLRVSSVMDVFRLIRHIREMR